MHVVEDDEQPQERWYPGNLTELLWVVKQQMSKGPPVKNETKVCGSHWAMSEAAVTDGQMIETATPVHEDDDNQAAPRLNHVLYEVIPACMTQEAKDVFVKPKTHAFDPTVIPDKQEYYLFHVEAGMRIYELYAYMDSGNDGRNENSLAYYVEKKKERPAFDSFSYLGPWALETMGGAGGQTIGGVASTATHGGDVASSAIGDAIVAIHLISPNGQEYWIERTSILPHHHSFKLVDEPKLQEFYKPNDPSKPGGEFRTEKIIYRQDDDLMNAAIVSCGRMGIIYSVVVRAIQQFALREKVTTSYWNDVRTWITDETHPTNETTFENHFVRIDVDVYPQPVFDWHTAAWLFGTGALGGLPLAVVGLYAGIQGDKYRTWVMTRELLPLQAANIGTLTTPRYYGRDERGASNAGGMPAIENQGQGAFRDPCGSANWLRQFLQDLVTKLEDIRNDAAAQWLVAEGVIAATTFTAPLVAKAARAYQGVLENVMLFCQVWIHFFSAIQVTLPEEMLFGDFLSALLNTFSELHAHSIIQLMYWVGANAEHPDVDEPITAISYAVMDRHNYKNKGCIDPGDSIEFFIDGKTPGLTSFVDFTLEQVRELASEGKGFGGYISLRFMKDSQSFLAMQRWPRTCSIEIAGLSKVNGCGLLLKRLEEESRKRDIILHWGQRNHRSQTDIEKVFSPAPGGALYRWRDALSKLSLHGRLHNFSNAYTRHKGLEITVPRLYDLSASMIAGCEDDTTTIRYNAFKNPPETKLFLRQQFTDGHIVNLATDSSTLRGDVKVLFGRGRSTIKLEALRELNGNPYWASPREIELQGFRTGDSWKFEVVAEKREVDTVERWYVEINLFNQLISNTLRVSSITLATPTDSEWVFRDPDIGTSLVFTSESTTVELPWMPIFNRTWQFFSQMPATSSLPPTVSLSFTMTC